MELVSALKSVGRFCYYNGDEYDGEWKEDLKEGKGLFSGKCIGVYKYNNGDKYEGDWKSGIVHGRGKTYVNGRSFELL